MGILKYVHYIYLLLAALFIYDAFERLNSGIGSPWLSLAFAAGAIFMFFFRKKFSKKMEDRYKK